jgi:predicted outer membrane protein
MLACLSVSFVLAQERPPTQDQAERNVERKAAGSNDRMIAECLGIGNQEEIALATLAAAKSQNPQVKQFAEKLVKDHAQALAQLERFGAQKIDLARVAEARARLQERAQPENRAADRISRQTAAREDGFNFIDVKRQMAQKCLQNAQREWSEKSGAEADQCFVGSQLVLHQQMIDGQEVLKQYASPELARVIDESIATTQAHLDHAKQLMKQLVPQAAGAREERTERRENPN